MLEFENVEKACCETKDHGLDTWTEVGGELDLGIFK